VAGLLRPIVSGQTVKYNMKKRAGRGFTLEELKEAGIPAKLAPTIGIAVDHRRRNRSLESLQENANRLKAYKANLVLFPRRAGKPKAGDSPAEELAAAQQLRGPLLPAAKAAPALEKVAVTEEMKKEYAYGVLRVERMNARMAGVREKRAKEAAQAEKDS
jgi:large subunit ribosomal protein L13e